MKGYSSSIPENCACARVEGVNASYKDLAQVCGSIRNKRTDWALSFLKKASIGEVAVLYRAHNKRLGHRRELGGRKGRYPKKAAGIVLKVLMSAIANGRTKGMGEIYKVMLATANKKHIYPRIASKGRWARANLETSRVEIILQGEDVPKGVSVTLPAKAQKKEELAEKKESKKEDAKQEAPEKKTEAAEKKADGKTEEKPAPKKDLNEETKENAGHKRAPEKNAEKIKPHHHGEYSKR